MKRRFAIALSALALCASAGPSLQPSSAASATAVQDAPIEVDILDLTGIDWTPGKELPESVTRLSGRRVVIRGYMHQSVEASTNRFPMVSDACQCVGILLPHHFVDINLGPRTTDPIPGSFEVIGTLTVGELVEDGFVQSVYRLNGRIY